MAESKGKKSKKDKEPEPAAPDPGTAGMAQGQPAAGVEGEPPDAHPEQPDKLATGGEALEEQQKNPELEDNTGNRGGA